MPEPLDLEAIRERADLADMAQKVEEAAQIAGRLYGASVPPHSNEVKMQLASAADVPALLAEVERLRLIAAPLERLEAWLHSGHDCRSRIFVDEAGVNVELDDGRLHRQQGADAQAETLPAAITSALDAWVRDYGKDGP